MIQGRCSDQSPVARTPQRAVETGRSEVAVSTPVRRWPGTTRCNELAVIVMRDGEPVGREPLIAPLCRAQGELMIRFALFVDGSNLFGSLKSLAITVDDYQEFYSYLFRIAEQQWRQAVGATQAPVAVLQRVYWYQAGSMDSWHLEDAQSQAYLKERFDESRDVRAEYMSHAGKLLAGKTQADVALKAWALCFDEMKSWYESKKRGLEGMKRFHHAVQSSTDLIDILEIGHWKLDMLRLSSEEKGLDARLAVDMVALEANYDVAVVVSGDADSIPSINLMKRRGKHVGGVEFVRGYPPEQKRRGFSSKIKLAADFVARIYEMELVSRQLAKKVDATGQV